MSNQQAVNVTSLFQTAADDGLIGGQAMQALTAPDLGATINNALGMRIDDVTASEVMLCTFDIDDSVSIRSVAGNSEAVRKSHNEILEALGGSKQESGILAHCRYLSGKVLYPYCLISQAIRMDSHNYNPNRGTPLYDSIVDTLAIVLAKTEEFRQGGVPVRSFTVIISDGAEMSSTRYRTPGQVRPVVADMLNQENHIIAGWGIDDGSTNFKQVFGEVGIPDNWILTCGNTASEIRKVANVVSKTMVRASQSAKSFSQVGLGGFGATP